MADQDARALLAERIYNDPVAGPEFKALIKKTFPQAQIADYDAKIEALKVVAPLQQKIVTMEQEREKERQERAREDARRAVMADERLRIRPDELPQVEELMQKELVGTHTAAAEIFRARQAVATPGTQSVWLTGSEVPGVRGAGGDDYKGIVEDRRGWTRNRVNQILTDFKNGQGNKWM